MSESLDRLTAALAGRYRIERQLGSGGMATVYLAEDLKHHRQVALKVLRPELAAVLGPERFLREIEIAAKLNHPHILPLFDSGEAEGVLYYVMPYVAGESLRERLSREKQLGIEDALQIAREVADALDYAHRRGVVHRDIKPENILLEERHAAVADFGIARGISVAGGERITATGVAVGTPEYMSPEQASGRGELDGRSDIYALGCVFYEMLAGHPPFTGTTAQEILARHSMDEVPSLSAARPGVPSHLVRTVGAALAKTPADRFSGAAQFASALAGTESAVTGPLAFEAPRHRRVAPLALIGGAAVIVVGAVLLLRARPGSPAYPRTAIAVLPFQNLSEDEVHAYFAGGLHDEILTQLSKVAALKVTSRTSVMSYTGPQIPPLLREIANDLGVGSIVEGSVQVSGRRLRVSVQLIDALSDAHLWAERYDRTLDDAFAIQSDIAQQVAVAVGAALKGSEQERLATAPTANAEAYLLYLQAHDYQSRPGSHPQNLKIAQELLERALVLDAGFVLARSALSRVHGSAYWLRYDPSPERLVRQREEAKAALQLAPDLPEAHFAMGRAYYNERDYVRALNEYRLAVKAAPNLEIMGVHRRLGNWDEALASYKRATRLDPRNANLFEEIGETYRFMGRYAEAVGAYDRALSLAPDFHAAAVEKARTYVLWLGELDTLRAVLSEVPADAPVGWFGTAAAYHLRLLHWERQADSMLVLAAATLPHVVAGYGIFLPRVLYAAWAHRLRADHPAMVAAFDSARVLLDSVVKELEGDWRVHAARGMALAGLGRKDGALQEARWLQQSVIYRHDAFDRPVLAEDRGRILAQVGETEAALDEIHRLLTAPSLFSVHSLRLDPLWDPIRDHPRFKALLAKYTQR